MHLLGWQQSGASWSSCFQATVHICCHVTLNSGSTHNAVEESNTKHLQTTKNTTKQWNFSDVEMNGRRSYRLLLTEIHYTWVNLLVPSHLMESVPPSFIFSLICKAQVCFKYLLDFCFYPLQMNTNSAISFCLSNFCFGYCCIFLLLELQLIKMLCKSLKYWLNINLAFKNISSSKIHS